MDTPGVLFCALRGEEGGHSFFRSRSVVGMSGHDSSRGESSDGPPVLPAFFVLFSLYNGHNNSDSGANERKLMRSGRKRNEEGSKRAPVVIYASEAPFLCSGAGKSLVPSAPYLLLRWDAHPILGNSFASPIGWNRLKSWMTKAFTLAIFPALWSWGKVIRTVPSSGAPSTVT